MSATNTDSQLPVEDVKVSQNILYLFFNLNFTNKKIRTLGNFIFII